MSSNRSTITLEHFLAEEKTVDSIFHKFANQSDHNIIEYIEKNRIERSFYPTLLVYAAKYTRALLVDFLLKNTIDLNATDTEGDTALAWAIYHYKGKYPQSTSEKQKTALTILLTLLTAGADFSHASVKKEMDSDSLSLLKKLVLDQLIRTSGDEEKDDVKANFLYSIYQHSQASRSILNGIEKLYGLHGVSINNLQAIKWLETIDMDSSTVVNEARELKIVACYRAACHFNDPDAKSFYLNQALKTWERLMTHQSVRLLTVHFYFKCLELADNPVDQIAFLKQLNTLPDTSTWMKQIANTSELRKCLFELLMKGNKRIHFYTSLLLKKAGLINHHQLLQSAEAYSSDPLCPYKNEQIDALLLAGNIAANDESLVEKALFFFSDAIAIAKFHSDIENMQKGIVALKKFEAETALWEKLKNSTTQAIQSAEKQVEAIRNQSLPSKIKNNQLGAINALFNTLVDEASFFNTPIRRPLYLATKILFLTRDTSPVSLESQFTPKEIKAMRLKAREFMDRIKQNGPHASAARWYSNLLTRYADAPINDPDMMICFEADTLDRYDALRSPIFHGLIQCINEKSAWTTTEADKWIDKKIALGKKQLPTLTRSTSVIGSAPSLEEEKFVPKHASLKNSIKSFASFSMESEIEGQARSTSAPKTNESVAFPPCSAIQFTEASVSTPSSSTAAIVTLLPTAPAMPPQIEKVVPDSLPSSPTSCLLTAKSMSDMSSPQKSDAPNKKEMTKKSRRILTLA